MADNIQITDDSKDQLAHITQEMYVKNMELATTNKTLSLLRTIDLLVLNSHGSLKELSSGICQAIVDVLGATATIILSLDSPAASSLNFQGWAVRKEAYDASAENLKNQLETTQIPLAAQWLAHPEKTLIVDASRAIYQVHPDPMNLLIQGFAQGLGVKTLYLTKLQARNTVVGVMGIALSDSGPKLDDMALYDRLSEAVGVAMDNKLLFEENQRVAKELEETNRKLKELDATKDEFISMASHQLRTPLTAIKGYLSMVLDGDVGPVTQDERIMIKRAFDGAQKMVYLIADLLNVSRLQSGKFIIENKPTNLAEVVDSEVSQLIETAEQRKISLTYQKPANFPVVMLDDNKIRQVVMNFIDNAIYYTPSGGRVRAAVGASGDAVEFSVMDTGVGVPKAVQGELFAKFYRADNARNMRPDGTGLGLFMAKKVIDAQGGEILFQSEEGKGSTFGFRFPITSVRPEAAVAQPAPPQS